EAIAFVVCAEFGGLVWLVFSLSPAVLLLRRLVCVAAAAGLTLALTAPHWWIFLDTLRQSTTLYDAPTGRFASLPFLVGLVFGPLTRGGLLPGAHALAVVLWLASFAVERPGRRALSAFGAAAAATIAILVAFGWVVSSGTLLRIPLLRNIE